MRAAALFVCLLACGGGSAATQPQALPTTTNAPKTYAVHLSSRSNVGDKLHVISDQTEEKSTKITAGDAVIDEKHEKRVIHLDAISTVLAVNGSGRATRTREQIADLAIDGKSVLRGVVEIERAPKEKDAVITVDGKPASDEARDALKSILKLSSGGPTDDDIFGTKTPQAIGAHWNVNTQLAHDDMKDDTGLDASTVTGDAWLEGVAPVDGKDALEFRAKMSLDGLVPQDIPKGSTVEAGRADVRVSATLPIDGKPERTAESMDTKVMFRMRVETPKGPAIVAVTVASQRATKFSLL